MKYGQYAATELWYTFDDIELINRYSTQQKEKQMKKSDLKTGMRVVHNNHPRHSGEICIVIKDLNKIMFADGSWNYLDSYSADLTMGTVWDVAEVYECPQRDILNFNNPGVLIWKRETQTPEQKQLQEVMNKISELTVQAEKLQGLINK